MPSRHPARILGTAEFVRPSINDTQVDGMWSAIANHRAEWMAQTQREYPEVRELDIVLGLTYGTSRTTNNKENQILVKLLENGFEEEDRALRPGVLIDQATRSVRVYRCVGQDFWAFIGNPASPESARFVFLEVLLALVKAITEPKVREGLEDQVNRKVEQLRVALAGLMFPRSSLPDWIRTDFSEDQLFWLATAMTSFFDEGI
jgi:hypothetical protein